MVVVVVVVVMVALALALALVLVLVLLLVLVLVLVTVSVPVHVFGLYMLIPQTETFSVLTASPPATSAAKSNIRSWPEGARGVF